MKEIFYINQERIEQARQLGNQPEEDKTPVRRWTREEVKRIIND